MKDILELSKLWLENIIFIFAVITALSYFPPIRKLLVKIGITKKISKETTLNDFLLDTKSSVSFIIIYMKNGNVISSDLYELEKLYKDEKLPYPVFRQDMDGITIYITKINDEILNSEKSLSLTYIPHSEIEIIDYTVNFTKNPKMDKNPI